MYKVSDYLLQAQDTNLPSNSAELRALETRGSASAAYSLWVLLIALIRLIRGRISGQLVGVHVNMAERLSVLRKGAIIVVSKMIGVPVVLHLHAAQFHLFYPRLPKLLQALTRWTFSLADTCVVLGAAAQRFVIKELKVPEDRVKIVFNGVPRPSVPRRTASQSVIKRLLFVGNLSERKGVSDLLQAMTHTGLKNISLELVLAGGGDVEGYAAKAKALGLADIVKFAGWSEQKDVARLMAQADVLILPSYDEGLPLVILEALANGVAVVCCPVGEIPNVLTDRQNACFIQPGDIQGLSEILQEVLEKPALLNTLEENGRILYEKEFSLAHFFNSIAQIHQRSFGMAARAGVANRIDEKQVD